MDTHHKIAVALTCGTVVLTAYHFLCKYKLQTAWDVHNAVDQFWPLDSADLPIKSRRKRTAKADPVCDSFQYDWAQSLEEVLVEVLVPSSTTPQDVCVKFGVSSLMVAVHSQSVISGQLSGDINPSISSWHLEGRANKRVLSITLCKSRPTHSEGFAIWESLLLRQPDSAEASDQLIRQQQVSAT